MNTIYTSTKKALSLVALVALMITGLFTDTMAQTWTIGTGTTSNTTTGYPCVYGNYYYGARQQFVYRASELSAAGMTAGSVNQIAFNVTGNAISQPNFYIAMKNSATTALTAWEAGMTTVYGPIASQTTSIGWNTYAVSAFSWDGTSNIIVEVCVQGTVFTTNVQTQHTTLLPTNSSRTYRADAAGVCASGLNTTITNTTRPNARFIRLSACSGTPNAGTASAPSAACSGNNFTVSATGLSTGSGISYKWQRSTDGGASWNDIPLATGTSAVVSQTVATQYRIYTLCSTGPNDNISNVVSVSMASFWACYCSTTSPYGGATSPADEDIGNVTVTGQSITLNNTTACATPNSTAPGTPSIINQYQNYTNLASVPDLGQASTYNISLTSITCGGNYGNGFIVWIDFDQSGTFDAGEVVYNSAASTTGPHTENGTISIPGTATLGTTGMLVKCIESAFPSTNTACASFLWGEAELYRVTIVATPPCSGTPAAGTASATPAGLVCPGTIIALSATGLTNAPGITYQWQANNTTLGGWTDLPAGGITVSSGSVTSAAVNVTGQSENTQYRIFTNCAFGSSNVSNTVSLNNDVPTNCYCIPTYTSGNTFGDFVNSVTVNTLSNLNTGPNASTFTLYPTTPANLTTTLDIGASYDLIVQTGTYTSNDIVAWIDFNQDGDFIDLGEKIGEILNIGATTNTTINFTVPGTATAGLTRLRVRDIDGTSGFGPCTTYSFGETEDYQITLAVLPNCAAAPVGGTTVTSGTNPACTGIPFNLTVTGSTTGVSGLAYQWQRNDGAGWNDIAGGNGQALNGFSYTGTDPLSVSFRRRIICTNTLDTAYSSTLAISRIICYCSTSFTGGNGAGFFISRVRVEGGALDQTSAGAGAAPAYQDFTAGAGSAGTGSRTSYYWLRLNSGTNVGTHYYGAWMDWNQDGDFVDLGENLCTPQYTTAPAGAGNGGTVNILFQVPAGATLGNTRMRVRTSGANPFAFLAPCTNYTNGETEDYDFLVTSLICPPEGSVAGNLAGVSPTFTTNNDIVTPNIAGGTGTLISWQFSFDNFTTVAGSFIAYPDPAPLVHLLVNPQPFVYVRAVYQNEGCATSNSNVAFVKVDCANNITNGAQDNDNIANMRLRTLPGLVTLIDNTSTFDPVFPDGFQNFKTITADIERGKQYELRITPSGTWSEHCAAWIDFNGDGVWTNNEMVARSTTALTTAQTFTITIPCSLTDATANYTGDARLRVMTKFAGTPIDSNACSLTTYGYGEIEDYTVNILPLPNLTVTPPNAVCVPAGGTVTASGGTGTYTWAPATGISATTGATITLNTIPTLQFYTINGTQPGTGCAINQTFAAATLPIGGNAIPATSVVCSGTSKLFTASGSAGNLQWQTAPSATGPWTDVAGATNNTYNLTGITATTYVRVLAKSAACFDISSTTAIVNVSATPVVSIINVTSTTAVVTWAPYGSGQYNIAWTGAGTGSASAVTTNNYALSGLTPNTNLNVTVTQATPTCVGTSPGTATTKTLCGAPTISSLVSVGGSPNPVGIRVNWSAVAGATSYRIYYRNIGNNANWQFIDTTGGLTKTIMQSQSTLIASGAQMAVYVAVNGCPGNPVTIGTGSNVSYVTIPPSASCLNIPTFSATSNCPNQITVSSLAGSTSGTYDIQFRRIFPTVTSGVVYTTTSTTFNLTLGSQFAGAVYEVYVRSNCGATRGNYSVPVLVNVKPGCPSINNPVLSNLTCYGTTISWNSSDCNGIGVSGYYLYIKKQSVTGYSAYPIGSNVYKVVNWLAPNTAYDIFVRSVACNGSLSANSPVLQFTTGGPGCREEEAENVEAVNGNGEMINIFPNPTNGNFSVSVNSTDMEKQEVRIEVINALGQVMVTNVTNMTGGNIIEGIQLDNSVSAGVYFVRVQVGNNVYVNRLVLGRD